MHHREVRPDDVLPQIIELGIGQRGAGKTQLDNRHGGGAVAQHHRGGNVGGHVLKYHQRAAGQLRYRGADIRAFVKVDLLYANALVAGGFDARDVINQRGHLAFMEREDPVLDVRGAHATVGPDDTDHRDINLRKNVDRHAQRRADAEQADQDQ